MMHVSELELSGAFLVEPERVVDERGYFARTFCRDELRSYGLKTRVYQSGISHNECAGTLRGLHWQDAPHGEAKFVQCIRGRIFDVIVDLRTGSDTELRWTATELSASSGTVLYVPQGFAHGFQTLEDNCDVLYHITAPYCSGAARGIRWNDSALAIEWPFPSPTVLSERDRALPSLDELGRA